MDSLVTIEVMRGVQVVNFLFCEMSLENAEELKKRLYARISDTANRLIIDFHRCSFMSSVALGVLISVSGRVHQHGGRIVFCSPTPEVRAILSIAKFDKIYDIYQTREEALASFGPGGKGTA